MSVLSHLYGTQEGKKMALELLELELQVIVHWVLLVLGNVPNNPTALQVTT